jgi:hypothetical protein
MILRKPLIEFGPRRFAQCVCFAANAQRSKSAERERYESLLQCSKPRSMPRLRQQSGREKKACNHDSSSDHRAARNQETAQDQRDNLSVWIMRIASSALPRSEASVKARSIEPPATWSPFPSNACVKAFRSNGFFTPVPTSANRRCSILRSVDGTARQFLQFLRRSASVFRFSHDLRLPGS